MGMNIEKSLQTFESILDEDIENEMLGDCDMEDRYVKVLEEFSDPGGCDHIVESKLSGSLSPTLPSFLMAIGAI